jgi:hypothetical protein
LLQSLAADRGRLSPGRRAIDPTGEQHAARRGAGTPRYEIAHRAAIIIFEIICGTGNRPKKCEIDLGFRLIARESTGKLTKPA